MFSIPSSLLSVDSAHPSLPGHFPHMPVVPGVVFLSFILDEARRQLPAAHVIGIRKLKFLQMLLPTQAFEVEFATPDKESLRFKCWRSMAAAVTAIASEQRELLADGNLQLAVATRTEQTLL
jgi:3-hydroxymyristoyl/3-hydroxydecanoyl-(acyl carrier protein) dehydratase